MKLAIKATHITLTEAIRAYVEQKVNRLDAKTKRFGDSVSAEAEVSMTTKHHKKGPIFRAELRISLPLKPVYAEAEDLNLYTAINKVAREVEAQISKYKSTADKSRRLAQKTKGGRA